MKHSFTKCVVGELELGGGGWGLGWGEADIQVPIGQLNSNGAEILAKGPNAPHPPKRNSASCVQLSNN